MEWISYRITLRHCFPASAFRSTGSNRSACWEAAWSAPHLRTDLLLTREAANTAYCLTFGRCPRKRIKLTIGVTPPGGLGSRRIRRDSWTTGKPSVGAAHTAPAKLDEPNDRVRTGVRRLDTFVDRLVDEKLALPFFTLQEILQVVSSMITDANTLVAAAKAAGREPSGRS